jgi:hypothetical protein
MLHWSCWRRTALLGSLFDLLFSCKHRRTTFPFTPVKRKTAGTQGEFPAETYVVCLDCGKQFAYDWETMQLGNAVDISQNELSRATQTAPIPFRTKSTLKYLALGSAVSAAVVVGKVVQSRLQSRKSTKSGQDNGQAGDIENPQKPRTPQA